MGLHKTIEAVTNGRDVLNPLNDGLGIFALNGLQVDHVTAEEGKRHVNDRYKRNGSSLRVESRRKEIAHSSSSLSHQSEDQVEHSELRDVIAETNGEVDKDEKQQGVEQHNGDLSKHLSSGVNPDVVHVTSAFTNENRLFTLEDNNSRQEVEQHLHESDKVHRANHRVLVDLTNQSSTITRLSVRNLPIGASAVVVIKLPEDGNHEQANDDSLEDLGAANTGLTGSKNPGSVEKLFQLYRDRGVVSGGTSCVIIGQRQCNELVVDLNAVLDGSAVSVVELFELNEISFLLRVVNSENLHEVISGVAKLGYILTHRAEVFKRLSSVTLEHCETVSHQNDAIEVVEGFGGRLMDSGNDTLALLASKIVKKAANGASLEGIETGSRFIKQNEGGVGNELNTNGGTLALTTRENLTANITDLRVSQVHETELSLNGTNQKILLIVGRGKLETSSEGKCLTHGKMREENIVLHNIGGVTSIGLLIEGNFVVKKNSSRNSSLVDKFDAISQDIEQGSLTSTGGAHNVSSLTGRSETSSAFDDLLTTVLLSSGSDLFLGLLDLDLKAHIVP